MLEPITLKNRWKFWDFGWTLTIGNQKCPTLKYNVCGYFIKTPLSKRFLIRVLKCNGADPTGMCIKSAPYLHQKRANLALNRVLLLCFSPDVAYYLKVQFWHNFFNNAKFAQNNQILCIFIVNNTKQMHFLHHCRKLGKIRYSKGAGTKMHNCLVGIFNIA